MQGLLSLLMLGATIYALYFIKEHIRQVLEKKHAKEKEEDYWTITEPKYRNHKKYPPDWQTRRAIVFFRENGRCEKCKKMSGSIKTTKLGFWLKPYINVRGSHVHHKKPISAGGNHDFSNLQLLCENCHDRAHPNKGLKKSLQRARSINRLDLSCKSKVKTSRKNWSCRICSHMITTSNKYFGDTNTKICMKCYEKYNKSISQKIGY